MDPEAHRQFLAFISRWTYDIKIEAVFGRFVKGVIKLKFLAIAVVHRDQNIHHSQHKVLRTPLPPVHLSSPH
jgi:hypothetical protein